MDHDVVVRLKMTERYLLGELEPDSRDRFEEHFFDCPDCALDVRAASQFVEKSKFVFAKKAGPVSVRPPLSISNRAKPGWFAWLRPQLMAPVMALLLAVIGYQNLVMYPQMRQALRHPRVLSWAAVNVATWGSGGPAIAIRPGEGFLLFLRIPPDASYPHYVADLYNPAGKLEWSLTIPATSGQDQWPIQVPGANRAAGSYSLVVRGVTASAESREVGRSSFNLQIQQ